MKKLAILLSAVLLIEAMMPMTGVSVGTVDVYAEESIESATTVEDSAPDAISEESVSDDATEEKSVSEKSVSEKSVSEKSVSEESVSEESVSEESVSEESVSEESVSDDSVSDDAIEESVSDDAVLLEAETKEKNITVFPAYLSNKKYPVRLLIEGPEYALNTGSITKTEVELSSSIFKNGTVKKEIAEYKQDVSGYANLSFDIVSEDLKEVPSGFDVIKDDAVSVTVTVTKSSGSVAYTDEDVAFSFSNCFEGKMDGYQYLPYQDTSRDVEIYVRNITCDSTKAKISEAYLVASGTTTKKLTLKKGYTALYTYMSADNRYLKSIPKLEDAQTSEIQSWLSTDNKVYSCGASYTAKSSGLAIGKYDMIIKTNENHIYRYNDAVTITDKPYISDVILNESGAHVFSDRKSDYVSVLVYGFNLSKSTVPRFYGVDEFVPLEPSSEEFVVTPLTGVEADQYEVCLNEQTGKSVGAYYRLTQNYAKSLLDYYDNRLAVNLPGGIVDMHGTYENIEGVETDDWKHGVELRGLNRSAVIRVDSNTVTEKIRIYLASDFAPKDSHVTVKAVMPEAQYMSLAGRPNPVLLVYKLLEMADYSCVVKSDDGGNFVEMPFDSKVGSSILAGENVVVVPEGTEFIDTISAYDDTRKNGVYGNNEIAYLSDYVRPYQSKYYKKAGIVYAKNLTVSSSYAWEVHSLNAVEDTIAEGTKGGKNLLTAEEIAQCEKVGTVRVCLLNKRTGKLVKQYAAYFGDGSASSTKDDELTIDAKTAEVRVVNNGSHNKYYVTMVVGDSITIDDFNVGKTGKIDIGIRYSEKANATIKTSGVITAKSAGGRSYWVYIYPNKKDKYPSTSVELSVYAYQPKWVSKSSTVQVGQAITPKFDSKGFNVEYVIPEKYLQYVDVVKDEATGVYTLTGKKKGTVALTAKVGGKTYTTKVKVKSSKK